MRSREILLAVCVAAWLWPVPAGAQSVRLTMGDALTRAREQAPRIVAARLVIEEAKGRLLGASQRFQNNPELEAGVGRRGSDTGGSTEVELGIQQLFEPSARRNARMAAAQEAIAQGSAGVDDATRVVMAETAIAFLRGVHAEERVKLLTAAEALATQIFAAADRRFKAGDIAVLDVNIARGSLARVRAEKQGAMAARTSAIGELKQLLGLDGDVSLDGSLPVPAEADLTLMLNAAAQRPELRQLEAAIREAEAEARLGSTFKKPDIGVAARYEREEGDNVLLGGITITLPPFAKGQELFAVGTARGTRLRHELESTRLRIQTEVRAAFDAYRLRVEAVRVLQTDALPTLDENEQLTTRSFEVGQLGLPELLLIRREILDTRFQYLDTLLEAALARIELHASAAVLR